MRVVVSQSMYFPWLGFLEQLRLANLFVQYDDVQFSKGGFTNRVQIKTSGGSRWLTVPLKGFHLGQRINEIRLDKSYIWRKQHRSLLEQAYRTAPFASEMLDVVDEVFTRQVDTLSELSFASAMALADYFGISADLNCIDSANLGIVGSGSKRVLEIVQSVGGSDYITGHGARHYLDHEGFESADITVHYMDYSYMPYPQLHGEFTPYVTALDLIANCGRKGARYIQSNAIEWKEFIHESA